MSRAIAPALLLATLLLGTATSAPLGERLVPCLACHG